MDRLPELKLEISAFESIYEWEEIDQVTLD